MTINAPAIHDYYDFEVSLTDLEPRICRRFLLPKGGTFQDLHKAIQDAGPWTESHLFAFRVEESGAAIAGLPIDDPMMDEDPDPDAAKVKLTSFFKKHDEILYHYDFGDDWFHEVKLLGTVSLPYKFKRALLGGERAFPPEDCGGGPGYMRCVKFRETGVDEWGEEEGLGEWLDGWQPEGFDLVRMKKKFDK